LLTIADSQKATLGLLRVSINLTNSNGEVCEALNRDTSLVTALTDIITTDPEHYSHAYHQEKDAQTVASAEDAPEQEEREANFDLLLLSLGLMINFVQESGKVKEMVLSTDLPGQINLLFEKLIARDVRLRPAFLTSGICKSCAGIFGSSPRTSYHSHSEWKGISR